MHRPTFTNVYQNLNIKKIRATQGGPLNRGTPCHSIIGILVNPALTLSKLRLIIGQIFANERGVPHFDALAGSDPCQYRYKSYKCKNDVYKNGYRRRSCTSKTAKKITVLSDL